MSLQHPADFKRNFYEHVYQQYPSVAKWAQESGFKPHDIYVLLNGACQGSRGKARKAKRAIEQIVGSPMPHSKKRNKK
ncbi:hypothetical protein AAH678_03960 [Sodalis endosymbiont of Spalangia cameroni]|uniref:hypothetical protein n=1 Tax=Sodalis praecaptivus TaxID=1239307 RepID=UPI0031F9EAD9